MGGMTNFKRIYGPVFESKTYLETLFLLLGLVSGIVWLVVFVTLLSVGVGLVIIWVGVAILVGALALFRPVGAIERAQVRWLLGHDIPAPDPLVVEPVRGTKHPKWWNLARWSRALVHDQYGWRVFAWTGIRMVAGPVGFCFAMIYIVVPLSLLFAPFMVLFEWEDVSSRSWTIPGAFGPLVFLIVTPALAWVVRWLGDLHRRLADWLLGPNGDEGRHAALARASRAEEQIRIDQELHDSIGHMVSMIVVQAGAGAHVFDKDPAFARRALGNIEERGRAALGELDRLIARIRGDQPETHAPLPGTADLPALIEGARDAGVAVTSRLELGEVPPALGRGIYRVIQEALTNAAKHAPGGEVVVMAVSDDSLVSLAVTNTLTASRPSATSGGNGLASIRDRVTLMGGHATVGPASNGRFAVKAILPIEGMLPDGGPVDCNLTEKCKCLGCRIIKRSSK